MKAAIIIFTILFLAGCTTQEQGTGYLQGMISIGPLCPVETFPPQLGCAPTEQTYLAYPLTVYSDGKIVTQFHGDANGSYRIPLPEGKYSIKSETGLQTYSGEAEIMEGQITVLDIEIDTGIR